MRWKTLAIFAGGLVGCSGPLVAPDLGDSGPEDAAVSLDAALADADAADAAVLDSGPADAGETDAGLQEDAGPDDAGLTTDAGSQDAGIEIDAGPDAGIAGDAGAPDAGAPDGGPQQVCGDGIVESPEQCDLGNLNGTNQGCSATCQFDCQMDSDCSDGNDCDGTETCVAGSVMGEMVMACQAGTNQPVCTVCATGFCDGNGQCAASNCGDGCLDTSAGEQCDWGATNNITGSGCDPSCQFSCTTNPNSCDDGNPCNGQETCGAVTGPNNDVGQACSPGTPEMNGASCGMGLVCESGICTTPPEVCGDGVVQPPEQCDLGNLNGSGQGCTTSCRFDCQQDADCADNNSCNGSETCVDSTVSGEAVKICQAGTNEVACTVCATGFCDGSGQCAASSCGDGCLDTSAGEQCDWGSANNVTGSGCNPNCQFSCMTNPNSCDDGNPCNGVETCGDVTGPNNDMGQTCSPGTALMNGAICGPGLVCENGMCTTPPEVCGDGVVQAPEQCDLGNLNGTGQGCTASCRFDCQQDSDCADNNTCNGTETCADVTVSGEAVKVCQAGTNEAACTACTTGLCDGSGQCAASSCGDGCLDTGAGEQCDWGTASNVAGSGCNPNCQFSCTTNPNSCDDGNPCNGVETCGDVTGPNNDVGQTCSPGTPLMTGAPCGNGMVCENGMCTTPPQVCGDGIVESPEQCDLGNLNGTGQGCTASCRFDCQQDSDCADNSTCNGTETCVDATVSGEAVKVCQAGTNEATCTTCATGFCNGSGQCDASTCGDGCVDPSAGEQCDLGSLNGTGQGCSATCQLDCQQDADCFDGNSCNGTETCVSATVNSESVKVCQAGTNESACTACSTGFCDGSGQCAASSCGDGCLDTSGGEQCDWGAANNVTGSGCNPNCQFSCTTNPNSCDDGNPCDGVETCGDVTGQNGDPGQACAPGTPQMNGVPCGNGHVCENGLCTTPPPVCGDGVVQSPEQCDLGNLNGTGQGCTSSCRFDCQHDADCSDNNACNGTETCVDTTVSGEAVKICQAGAHAGACTACATGFCDGNGQCAASSCGDGCLDASTGEQCDWGSANNVTGSGCNPNCQFSCTTNPNSCDDGNPCNGLETCGDVTGPTGDPGQACSPGTPLMNGVSCGGSLVCENGMCTTPPQVCGDGIVESPEQCDLGNVNGTGQGCTASCRFDCQQDSDCSDNNTCNGTETCADSTVSGEAVKICEAGTNEVACTACTTGFCDGNGQCAASACGDGCVDASAGEQCDLGNLDGTGEGCNASCQFDCQTSMDCTSSNACVADACVSTTVDNETVQVCQAATNEPACTTCPTGFCNASGQCAASSCGDGCVDTSAGEQCDLGALNGTGQGCTATCQFDCQMDSDCSNGNVCDGTETCVSSTLMGETVKNCQAGTNEAACSVCSTGFCNGSGQCNPSSCGDGCVDASAGEQCDLGNVNGTGQGCTATCQFDCEMDSDCSDNNPCNGVETCVSSTLDGQTVKNCEAGTNEAACTACPAGFCDGSGACNASACGDGCLDQSTGEQCDDGNLYNLDGCDSTCKYEMITRMTSLAISGNSAPSFCTPATNRLGTYEIASIALSSVNTPLQQEVTSAGINFLTQYLGLTDLTGGSSAPFNLGVAASNIDPAKGTWPGNAPIDWWFLAQGSSVLAGLPTNQLPATLTGRALAAGPGNVDLPLSLGSGVSTLHMHSSWISASIHSATDAPSPPPAQLASGLVAFETVTATGNRQGLCGNITVESLAAIPIPQSLTTGSTSCSCGTYSYTYCGSGNPVGPNCNSLLDALVGGCVVPGLGCFISVTAIHGGQPDVPAHGSVTHLSLGSGNKVPTSTTNGDEDAYSAYLTFSGNRAHFTGQTCAQTSDCQTGQTCTSGVCK